MTPSPCPHLELIYTIKFRQPPLLRPLFHDPLLRWDIISQSSPGIKRPQTHSGRVLHSGPLSRGSRNNKRRRSRNNTFRTRAAAERSLTPLLLLRCEAETKADKVRRRCCGAHKEGDETELESAEAGDLRGCENRPFYDRP